MSECRRYGFCAAQHRCTPHRRPAGSEGWRATRIGGKSCSTPMEIAGRRARRRCGAKPLPESQIECRCSGLRRRPVEGKYTVRLTLREMVLCCEPAITPCTGRATGALFRSPVGMGSFRPSNCGWHGRGAGQWRAADYSRSSVAETPGSRPRTLSRMRCEFASLRSSRASGST